MVENGNPNSVTDAGVGALAARSAVLGAYLNVRINGAGLNDKAFVESVIAEGRQIEQQAIAAEENIIRLVNQKINQ